VALTRSGKTAKMIARYRPAEKILALTDTKENLAHLMLTFGCYPMVVPTLNTVEEIMNEIRRVALEHKVAEKGNKVVIVAGMPFGKASETNMILVETL
jgi:pyruvate kinase